MANPSLTVVNNLEAVLIDGNTLLAKQGGVADDFGEGADVTITGYGDKRAGALSTASVRKLFDSAIDFPTDPIYWHFWATGVCYLQLIGATTSFTVKIAETQLPFAFRGDSLLAAAATTAIAGGAEPAVEAVAKVYLGNYSGASINYCLTFIK